MTDEFSVRVTKITSRINVGKKGGLALFEFLGRGGGGGGGGGVGEG